MPSAALLLTLAATVPAAPPSRYIIKTEDAKRVQAVLTYTVTYPTLQATEWVWFAAAAPELPGQVGVRTTLAPAGTAARDQSPLARPVLMARVPADTPDRRTMLAMKVVYEATLRARTLEPLRPGAARQRVPALPEDDRRALLDERGDVVYSADSFQQWMTGRRFVRGANEPAVEFARRVFLGIRANFTYEFKPDMDRTAPAVCRAGKSDCGGLSALFVAVMRANRVPARVLCGRWADSAMPGEKVGEMAYYQWHAKAEFFADGVGWVPVDVASGVLHDTSKEGLRYFGRDPGDFLTLHIDTDLALDTKLFGEQTVHNLQRPAYWVRGSGALEPSTATEGWVVEKK